MYAQNYQYNENQKGDKMMRKTLLLLSLFAFICAIGLLIIAYQVESDKTKTEVVMSQIVDGELFNDEIDEDASLGFGEDQEPEIVETMITASTISSFELMLDSKIRNL